jgi:hypothetical protein
MLNGYPADLYDYMDDEEYDDFLAKKSPIAKDIMANDPRQNQLTACNDCSNIVYIPKDHKIDLKEDNASNNVSFNEVSMECKPDTSKSQARFSNYDFYDGFSRYQSIQLSCDKVAPAATLKP